VDTVGIGGGGGEVGRSKIYNVMSILELDDDEDDDEDDGETSAQGMLVTVQDGDDDGVWPMSSSASSETLSNTDSSDLEESTDLGGAVGRGSGGVAGVRETFVELTRRVLDDLDSAKVTGSGTMDIKELRKTLQNFQVDDNSASDGDSVDSSNSSSSSASGGWSGFTAGRGKRRRGVAPESARRFGSSARNSGESIRGGRVGGGQTGGGQGRNAFKSRLATANVPRWPLASDGIPSAGADGARRDQRSADSQRGGDAFWEDDDEQVQNNGVQILLVRHGQSTWNAQGRWQGQADMPLSSLGVAQSALAAIRLAGGNTTIHGEDLGIRNITAVYSSNMQRAVQVCTYITDVYTCTCVQYNTHTHTPSMFVVHAARSARRAGGHILNFHLAPIFPVYNDHQADF